MKKVLTILMMLLTVTLIHAQQQPSKLTVTGTVLSAENNQPLQGASVLIKGAKKGLVTDALGKFTAKVEKNQILVISFAGFEPQEIKVTEATNLAISMQVRVVEGEEVVVVGYGTRKKSHLTGAIAKVTNDNLGQIPVSRADQALQGKLAGVNITTTDAQAGAAPTIQIRGATSITAGTEPLIVIDGYPVPTDLSAIDMNDVESIEVLKDAASAAIYGSRGGNGVIIITTKSGKVGKGKLTINISRGIKSVYRKLNFPSLQEWKAKVLAENGGVLPASGEIAQAEKFDANTDAQDFIFRNVNYTNFQIGASGGTTTFKYYLSATALLDDGVMIGNDYKRFGLRAGFNAKVNPRTTIDFSFTPSYTEFFNVPVTVQEALRTLSPWTPVYHTDTTAKYTGKPVGSIANQRDFSVAYNPNYTGSANLNNATSNNPILQLNGTIDKRTQIRNISNFSVRHEIGKYLSFKSTVGFLFSEDTRSLKQKSWAQSDPLLDGEAYARSTSKAILTKIRTLDLSNENTLNYKRIIKKHDIDAVIGFSEQYTQLSYFNGQAGNFSSDENLSLNAGVMQALSDTVGERALVSALFRFNYAYSNKYLFSVSARTDASSRFAPEHRWGFFPAASAGWRISNEKFYPDNKVVNDLKLRISYGTTGNENIGNYRYIAKVDPTYTVLGNYVTPSTQLRTFGNENLEWERTFSTNIGADMGLFNNKIRLSVEYYNTKTDKLLLDLPIAASTGFTTYATNKGKVQNAGFEFEISSTLINKKNFKWTLSANGYTNKNKLIDFDGSYQQINQGDPKRANFFLTRLGQPLVQYFGYVATQRVPMTNTNYWPININSLHSFVQDQNKDGIISDADRVILGDPYPKFNWGLTTNFQYKEFDLSITLQGSHGGKVFNIDPYYFETQFATAGNSAFEKQGYTAGQIASLQLNTQTDLLIEDASFIALRNVNLGYSFLSKTAKKWGLGKLRLYVTTANLWYHFASGYSSYNPEADNAFPNDPLRKGYQRGAVPLTRNITFGLNVDF
jgi:TonB-linked SusC/RagA family outer membrane protein